MATIQKESAGLSALTQVGDAERIVDVVHGTLRRAIARRELEPGFHLSVPALAEHLGVSRSPVREAVQRLVAEGLAAEQPRRGAFVSRFDLAALAPAYQVRMALEGLAANLAARAITPQWVDHVGTLLEEERRASEKDDLERHIDSDIAFHRAVLEAAGNPVLTDALGKIYDRIHSAMIARAVPTGPQRALDDHVAIFAAVKARNPEAAEAAARNHVARVLGELVKREDASGE
jgi:DNA-binding GntR family transcriptional regulator